jgi:hypothetical protein
MSVGARPSDNVAILIKKYMDKIEQASAQAAAQAQAPPPPDEGAPANG